MGVAASKIASLARSVARARAEFAEGGQTFRQNFTRQDAAILNVMRACESAVDLANIVVRTRKLGIPKEMRGGFALLEAGQLITRELSSRLQKMIGFRNIAVHQYQELDLDIVDVVIREGLEDLLEFAEVIRPYLPTAD
jgi:uncharacterized protein YutE (UPF0331/DUF86 family)